METNFIFNPDGTAYFDLNLIGNKTQATYMGQFKVHCILSPIQFLQADQKFRALLGPNPTLAGDHVINLCLALSQTSARIIEAPPFWKNPNSGEMDGGHIKDHNIILEVFDLATKVETEYTKSLKDKAKIAINSLREKYYNQDEEDLDKEDSKVNEPK